ncbi:MAG TPA: type VI secretion system baseplate subunit TssG [Blastocatellia bacterium]
MGTKSGSADTPLISILFDEAYRFNFFQAVRLMSWIYPDRVPVGGDGPAVEETTRFRSRVSMQFPPSQIHGIDAAANGHYSGNGSSRDHGDPARIEVAFMGLTGPLGVLPAPYTELLIERTRYKDTALWEFLDIFNHRLISLFYRAWEKYRFAIAYERGAEDGFTSSLFDIVGIGTRGLRGRMSVPDQVLIFYGGLVAQSPHSAAAVENVLSDYFGVPVQADQFHGQWLRLEEDNLTRLGSANSELGVNTIAGSRVWDNQSKFRLQFGPMNLRDFSRFVPSGDGFKPAAELTRFMVGKELDFDFQLVLKAEEVPKLVSTTRAKRRPQLAWTSWLRTRPFTQDDSQVVLATPG